MPVYEFSILLDEEGRVLGVSEGDHNPETRLALKKFYERLRPRPYIGSLNPSSQESVAEETA